MDPSHLVSIVVNCYNSEKYIRDTLDSILTQKYKNYEVIVWDNQSTDDTASIVQNIKDSRIHYYCAKTHTSLGEARNKAISYVRGEYLAFLDSDDIWLPDFLDKAVNFLSHNKDKYSFYYSNYYNWIDSKLLVKNSKDVKSGPKGIGDMLQLYLVGMSASVINMSIVLDNHILFDNRYQLIEDYDFFLRLSNIKEAYFDSHLLMKYRIHESSLTNKSKRNWGKEFELLHFDLIHKYFTTEQVSLYKKELKWLEVRAINSNAEDLIIKGDRKALLSYVLSNCHVSLKLLFTLLFLVCTKEQYFKAKGFVNSVHNRVKD